MAMPLRVCLFSQFVPADGLFSTPFREFEGLRIIAECSTWQHLQSFLNCGHLDAVIVNLDGGVDGGPYIVQRIAEVAPQCAIIGVSANAHPDTIIAAMRAGCSQFVRWPIDAADLRSALSRIKQAPGPAALGCQRICVVGSSGGAGATTVACNLAMELAQVTERRCALVDMNLQFGDVACSFDVAPRYTVADVCRGGTEIDRTLLESALESLPCQVSILARPERFDTGQAVNPDGVEQMFRVLGQMFPFIVVDLPRSFTPPVVAALGGADRVLIVSQLTVPNLRNASRIFQHLLELGADEEQVDLVLNRCNANFERIKPDEAEKHFGRPALAVIPNDYKRIGASRDLGHPIMTDAPNSPARLAIQEMAKRLASEHLGADSIRGEGAGLFGLFRKRRSKAKQPT